MKAAALIVLALIVAFFLLPSKGKDDTDNTRSRNTSSADTSTANAPAATGSLASVAKSHPLVLVDFWAPWCGPCRSMMPTIEYIEKKHDVYVMRVNVDDQPSLAREYGVQGIPTFLIFKDGKLVGREVGAVPESRITRHF